MILEEIEGTLGSLIQAHKVSQLTRTVWKDRLEGSELKREEIEQLVIQLILDRVLIEKFQHPAYCANVYVTLGPLAKQVLLVELFGSLWGILNDSNKNLVSATLTAVGNVSSAMGAPVEKASEGILSDILKCTVDNKKHMGECTLATTLDSWQSAVNLDKMVPYITTAVMETKHGADGHRNLFDWVMWQLSALRDFNDVSVMTLAQDVKNLKDIQVPGLAFVLEQLEPYGSLQGPTSRRISNVGKPASNGVSKPGNKTTSSMDREMIVVNKFKFEELGFEQIQDLENGMMKYFREDLHRQLLITDFKKHFDGLEMLQKFSSPTLVDYGNDKPETVVSNSGMFLKRNNGRVFSRTTTAAIIYGNALHIESDGREVLGCGKTYANGSVKKWVFMCSGSYKKMHALEDRLVVTVSGDEESASLYLAFILEKVKGVREDMSIMSVSREAARDFIKKWEKGEIKDQPKQVKLDVVLLLCGYVGDEPIVYKIGCLKGEEVDEELKGNGVITSGSGGDFAYQFVKKRLTPELTPIECKTLLAQSIGYSSIQDSATGGRVSHCYFECQKPIIIEDVGHVVSIIETHMAEFEDVLEFGIFILKKGKQYDIDTEKSMQIFVHDLGKLYTLYNGERRNTNNLHHGLVPLALRFGEGESYKSINHFIF